ncbi:MAG: hypothetical protein RLO51_16265 [Thalassobaculum sp.]|uniref:hypothetical protein n=1 Tax=Thalassobaculum sp. TaxID=2022740 RepID=UPI0032ECE474
MSWVDANNPRFDPAAPHCRTLHVHILGFAGAVPDWIAGQRGVWLVASAAEFDALRGASTC